MQIEVTSTPRDIQQAVADAELAAGRIPASFRPGEDGRAVQFISGLRFTLQPQLPGGAEMYMTRAETAPSGDVDGIRYQDGDKLTLRFEGRTVWAWVPKAPHRGTLNVTDGPAGDHLVSGDF